MKLYIKQKVFSWRDKFTVKNESGDDLYAVEGELFSWGKRLHVLDANGAEAAYIRQKVFALFPRYLVEMDGREVCYIQKKFSFFKPKYELEGIPWRVEGDFWAHEYKVWDGERQVMGMSKHWFTWGDSYEIDIARNEDALLCLCIVLAVDAAVASEDAAASISSSGGNSAN